MRELLDRSLRGDVHVEVKFAPDLWPVEVDPGELELVILNLAVNARDAMPKGGSILLQATNAPNEHVRSEEHTSELQSLMRISYPVLCCKKHIRTPVTQHQLVS